MNLGVDLLHPAQDIYWHEQQVRKEDRQKLHGHQSFIIWFTGLSGSGKSTIANALEKQLHDLGVSTYLLDGDNVRSGLNKDLSFKKEDRVENIRRVGEVAKLFIDAGTVVLAAFVSPYQQDRELVRKLVHPGEFIEVYINCSIQTCEERDPKGLYKKARSGEIKHFTGISDPYEAPLNPELVINSSDLTVDECVEKVKRYLINNGYLKN